VRGRRSAAYVEVGQGWGAGGDDEPLVVVTCGFLLAAPEAVPTALPQGSFHFKYGQTEYLEFS